MLHTQGGKTALLMVCNNADSYSVSAQLVPAAVKQSQVSAMDDSQLKCRASTYQPCTHSRKYLENRMKMFLHAKKGLLRVAE